MTIDEAKKLQRKLKRKGRVPCTLLVVPESLASIAESRGADIDFPVVDPFVISGNLIPSGFFVPDRNPDDDGWQGVFTVVVDGKEIPVQWIRDYVMGPAWTLVDPDGYPCWISPSFTEANAKYVELWPPKLVHTMSPFRYPMLLEPNGLKSRPSFSMRMGNYGLDYPWHA